MSKITLTLGMLLFSILGFSQVPSWSWAYNYDGFNNEVRGLTATAPNGDVYLAGYFRSASVTIGTTTLNNTGTNTGEIYIVKYDSTGTILWVKREGGSNEDYITSIATDGAGNLYLTGSFGNQTTLGTTTLNHFGACPFLAKYNAQGDSIWAKAIGIDSEVSVSNKIKVDPQGNVFMTGYYRSQTATFDTVVLTNNDFDVNTGGNSFLAKYNTSGNLIWAKGTQRTTSNAFTDISYDLAFDNAGNVFIGGTFFSSTMVFDNITLTNTQSPSTTMFMAKYDANGNVLWAKTPTSNNPNHYIWGISTDASGNVYFSGTFRATMTLDAVSISASSSGGKLFTVKCNSDGVAQWAKTATSNGYSAVDSSDVDSQGNLYVAGTFSDSTINFGNGITGSSPTTGAFFVVKYNTSGTPLWIRTASGLNINDRISIDCFSQNEIYVAGHFFGSNLTLGATTLTQAPTSGTDIFIAKLYYLPLGVDSFNADSVIFSPNPVDNMLYSNELDGSYNYVVRDFMGKKLTSGQVNSAMLQLSFGQYPSGIYFVEVQNEAGNTAVKKIIKK